MSTRLWILLMWAFLLRSVQAAPQGFQITIGHSANLVRFHSEATIESFDGTTRQVGGRIMVDPQAPQVAPTAYFQVDLASLDTGMSLRNKHMRENHLHTELHPQATFVMSKLAGPVPAMKAGVATRLMAVGDFTVHGVTLPRTLPVDVTWHPDGSQTAARKAGPVLHVVCRFEVVLADHGIPRPQFLFMKVAESMEVTVDLWATAG
ncbi:MAG: YceI family protein [bacterium]|jgi:polyisoprenoid-binding protein YceI|nr:YceI family protein [bacterium]